MPRRNRRYRRIFEGKNSFPTRFFIVNERALTFYQDQLFNSDKGKSIGLNYFKERGFREETNP
ncbi:MAG: hypothetical protein HC817_15335 [Saprospiraceae bacterium]|nr:hypothetical protein [Saprospiraceae bacterium]